MTQTVITRISRISFLTDMTRVDAPVIPLAFMLEGVWPEDARWLGLIGRTKLTALELDRINLTTWGDLTEPFKFLTGLFTQGLESQWGDAGTVVRDAWGRSALEVSVKDYQIAGIGSVDFRAAPEDASNLLLGELGKCLPRLAPVLIAPIIPIRRDLPVEALDKVQNSDQMPLAKVA